MSTRSSSYIYEKTRVRSEFIVTMGDMRFDRSYARLVVAADRARALSSTSDEGIIEALAAASKASDAMLANVLATEAMNRMRRARTAMAHLAEGVVSCDARGRVTHVNPAAESLLGRDREELVDTDIAEAIPAYADDGRRPRDECAAIAAIRSGSIVSRDDISYEHDDGRRVRLDLIAAPIVVDGAAEGAVVAFRDVTARKASEEALRRRAEQHALVAQLGLDALRGASLQRLFDTAVSALRRALPVDLTKVLQLDPGGKTLTLRAGIGWEPSVRPHKSQVDAGLDSQAGYTLISEGAVVVRDLAQDDRFNGPPLLKDHGVVSGMSVVIHGLQGPWGVLGVHARSHQDFTTDDVNFLQGVANALASAIQRSESETRMRRRIEERTRSLAEVNRDLQTFINSASHDLRAPLRGVDALLSALLEDHGADMDGEARELAERALHENRAAARLIQDLLAFARSAQSPVEPRRVDLSKLVRDVAAEVDATRRDTRTTWVVDEGMEVYGDPSLLRVAIHNLLDNAAKYSSDVPEPRVEVSVSEAPAAKRIRVRDNGVGFPMADASRLFEPFHRLSTADGFEGTGLGLATAMRIVARHGGSLRAQAEPGQGACFEIELPRPDVP